jgi:hypothetical protein
MNASNEQIKVEPVGEIVYKGKSMWNDFRVPQRMMKDEKFKAYTHSVKVVYFYLAHLAYMYGNNEGWFFHSLRNLAQLIGMDVKTVWAAKNQLVENGFLEYRDGGHNHLNGFRQAGDWRVRGGEIKPLETPAVDGQNDSRIEDVDD